MVWCIKKEAGFSFFLQSFHALITGSSPNCGKCVSVVCVLLCLGVEDRIDQSTIAIAEGKNSCQVTNELEIDSVNPVCYPNLPSSNISLKQR